MPVLHQMQMSGNCYKVRLAAHQLGISMTLKEYPLLAGDTRKPGFLSKNPNGRVPLLELDGGRNLPESDAILWYLSDGSPLQPDDAWLRAQALSWMFFEQYSHEPYVAGARFWLKYAPKDELEKKRHLIPEWHAKGNAALSVMEAHLKTHGWFAGKRYSVADIALYCHTHCAGDAGSTSLIFLLFPPGWRGLRHNRSTFRWNFSGSCQMKTACAYPGAFEAAQAGKVMRTMRLSLHKAVGLE